MFGRRTHLDFVVFCLNFVFTENSIACLIGKFNSSVDQKQRSYSRWKMINYGVNCVDVRLVQPHRHNFDLKSHFEENFQYFGVDGVGVQRLNKLNYFVEN